MKALAKAVKQKKQLKEEEKDPESTHEPKGKRGPPRKIQPPTTGAASSSQAPATTLKRQKEEDPEGTHEPKGKRGPPKKIQPPTTGAASSSQAPATGAASSAQIQMDTKRTTSHWQNKNKQYILDQLRVRGFDNSKDWADIQDSTKKELLKMVNDLIDQDKL